ncbi:hypothetical protein OROGR_014403 [Orobanche gracilis]
MSSQSEGLLTSGTSRKRKDRELFLPSTSTKPLVPQTASGRAVSRPGQATSSSKWAEPEPQQPLSSNRLLAGYMAYEFLNKGTLFGQNIDPAKADDLRVSSAAESKRNYRQRRSQASMEPEPSGKPKPQNYAEVANLLKSDAAYIPGIVNPTILARWIQMQTWKNEIG